MEVREVSQGQETLCKGPSVPGSVEDLKGGVGLEGLGLYRGWRVGFPGAMGSQGWDAPDRLPQPPSLGPAPHTLSSCPGPSPCLNPKPWGQAERLWQALCNAGPAHSLCPSSGLGNEATSAPSPQRASGGRRAQGGKLWETAGSPGALMGSLWLLAPDKDSMPPLSSLWEQGQSPSARGGGRAGWGRSLCKPGVLRT